VIVPLRVGIDLDGVLADMSGELVRQAETLFGPTSGPLSDGRQRRLWQQVTAIENFWMTLHEIEAGSISRLARAAQECGWEVVFVTKRPPTFGETAQRQTQRWLEAKGFRLPSVVVSDESRGKIAAALALDAIVDDRVENCVDVLAESAAKAILVRRGDTGRFPAASERLGLSTVASIDEAIELLRQMARD
jgi:hypothetical protein